MDVRSASPAQYVTVTHSQFMTALRSVSLTRSHGRDCARTTSAKAYACDDEALSGFICPRQNGCRRVLDSLTVSG